MRYLPNPPAPRPGCEVKIQIPCDGKRYHNTVKLPGHAPMSHEAYARLVHPVPVYVGSKRILAALSA